MEKNSSLAGRKVRTSNDALRVYEACDFNSAVRSELAIRDTALARMHPNHLRHARITGRPPLLGRKPSYPSSKRRQERRSPSPRDGWWWAHAGWLLRSDSVRIAALAPYVSDLRRDRFHCWLEKWHAVPLLALSVILAAWGTVRGGAFLAASLVSWGIFLRTVVELHGTWLVNSAAHSWGRRRFNTRDDSTNNWWVALLTFGEGWHNNHHADPRCVRHGLTWYELDVNWLCIHALHRIGLARKLCLPSPVRAPRIQRPEF